MAKRKCFIHVVHYGLKQSNENDMHYKPLLVSIGPYHHGNHSLQNMLKHKLHYLDALLDRKEEGDISRYTDALKNEGVESQALNCYVDTFTMSLKEFGECLVLDGLFMLELFRKNNWPKKYKVDSLSSVRWVTPNLARDLLLFENQLPLFVLYKLFEMTEDRPSEMEERPPEMEERPSEMEERPPEMEERPPEMEERPSEMEERRSKMEFIELAFGFFEFCGGPIPINLNLRNQLDDIPHLLGLVYHALVPKMLDPPNKKWESREFIRTAVALQEVGIKFEKLSYANFYDISFITGVLEIPRLVIDDNTESFFRNLVAYEQYSEDYSLHQVTDYLRIMDCLINSAKDVELLRHCGIIDNRIGDDAKVSNMFNKLCSGVYFDQNEFLYAETFDQVNEFCKKPSNVWMAKLKNDYFGNPWSMISFFAAATLLVLTMLQTVFTGISTF